MQAPGPLKPGDGLTLGWLNGLAAAGAANTVRVDATSGMGASVGSWGSALWWGGASAGWHQVTAAGSGGYYTLTQAIDQPGGRWSVGPRVRLALEANGNTSVPVASYVWAWRDRNNWRFAWGACS